MTTKSSLTRVRNLAISFQSSVKFNFAIPADIGIGLNWIIIMGVAWHHFGAMNRVRNEKCGFKVIDFASPWGKIADDVQLY